MMNRRGFLGVVAGVLALPKVMMRASSGGIVEPVGVEDGAQLMTTRWFQAARTVICVSMDYEDAIDAMMSAANDPAVRVRWHERRKERARANIEAMRGMRPLPLL